VLALNDDALGKEAEALAILNELADEDKDEGLLQVFLGHRARRGRSIGCQAPPQGDFET